MKPETLKHLQSGGTTPVGILREIKARHPEATNYDLSLLFQEECGPITNQGFSVIWRWRAGNPHGRFDNEELNAELTKILQDAGHDIPGEGPKEPEYRFNRESAVKLARKVAAKTNAQFDPDAKSVRTFRLPEPKEGGEWLVSFHRLEPDQQDRTVNVFIRDQTGEARLRSWRYD